MSDRLTRITTRTGDKGETGLADGSRVSKSDLRICVMGDVDELNSHIGLLIASLADHPLQASIEAAQHDLFELGSELAVPGQTYLKEQRVMDLEQQLKQLNATLPTLEEFVLPGGHPTAAQAHICRSVCRRAERSWVALHTCGGETGTRYLNRLSDYLFVISRILNRDTEVQETCWRGPDPVL